MNAVDFKKLEQEAIRYLIKFLGKKYVNQDNIDTMVRKLLQSMQTFDSTKKASLSTYLYQRALWTAMHIKKNVIKTYKENVASLDLALTKDSNGREITLYDVIPQKEESNINMMDKILQSKFLTERDKDIIHMIYVEDKTLQECATKYGVSPQGISQALKTTLLDLKICYKSREHLKSISEIDNE